MSATGSQERPTTGSDATLTEGEIHDVLRNDRRRLVLERLRDHGGSETVAELAEFIAAVEAGTSPPPRNVRQSVYVSLHQTHLPKLDELGIVTYDPNEKTVSLAAGAERVAPYMDGSTNAQASWTEFFAGVSLLGLVGVALAAAGVPLLDGRAAVVGGCALAVVGGCALAVVAVAAIYQ
ncbi:MAG: hypothetical protein ABEJ78_08610, partial [Haloferacaceae archaeon]